MTKRSWIGGAAFAAVVGLGLGSVVMERRAAAAAVQAPRFEVDPLWPKPLPNHWVIGSVIGVAVDGKDHVWIIHRPASLEKKEQYLTANPPEATCCAAAPPVLEFNQAGDLVGSWGGPGQAPVWPASNHGIDVDHKGNVWIGGNGRGAQPAAMPKDESAMGAVGPVHDSMVLKFTQSGKFLMQIGKPNASKGSNDLENLRLPAKTLVDPKTNELYVADGYGNRRVIVFDSETGAFKRYWGAYGKSPNDDKQPAYDPAAPRATQFANPVHCAKPSRDGHVYVCDRVNNRIQVFRKDGTFVTEWIYEPSTRGAGAVWDLNFWPDKNQTWLFNIDGENNLLRILRRSDGAVVGGFGRSGRQAGHFHWVHSIAVDSKGNIYTGEVDTGKRVQKFRPDRAP